ncbi:MAG TPA: hypothetical protein VN456_00290, partial [Desulfosporosinus sp.]|nr:hypothetical protein [Desulfosporosinus sp.]
MVHDVLYSLYGRHDCFGKKTLAFTFGNCHAAENNPNTRSANAATDLMLYWRHKLIARIYPKTTADPKTVSTQHQADRFENGQLDAVLI